jgi:hypothetical protein
VFSFTLWSLYAQRKSPRYPLDRRLGGPQSWSGRGSEEKNSQPLPGLKTLITQPIAQCYTTELSWLPVVTTSLHLFAFFYSYSSNFSFVYFYVISIFLHDEYSQRGASSMINK